MFRFTALTRLSQSAAYAGRHTSRLTKEALQHSRVRAQHQQNTFAAKQSLNEAFGAQQRSAAASRARMNAAAMDLVHGSKSRGRGIHRPTSEAAEDMAMARQLLMMQEASRKDMKRGRSRRTDEFRALKRHY